MEVSQLFQVIGEMYVNSIEANIKLGKLIEEIGRLKSPDTEVTDDGSANPAVQSKSKARRKV